MILRPRPVGKSPYGRPIPNLLNRHQQATLAVRVVAAFFIAVVLVVAFIIPHDRMALTGGGTMEKRTGSSPAPAEEHAAATIVSCVVLNRWNSTVMSRI